MRWTGAPRSIRRRYRLHGSFRRMDLCLGHPPLVVHRGRVPAAGSAGVVADSDPSREYEETSIKLRALEGSGGLHVVGQEIA